MSSSKLLFMSLDTPTAHLSPSSHPTFLTGHGARTWIHHEMHSACVGVYGVRLFSFSSLGSRFDSEVCASFTEPREDFPKCATIWDGQMAFKIAGGPHMRISRLEVESGNFGKLPKASRQSTKQPAQPSAVCFA